MLRYFITIAEEGSISKAAEKLMITQPTLSRQLKDLEQELGEPLFICEHKQMILTEAGHFLKDRAVDILELSMQTEEEFERRRQALFSGQKAIGCIESESSQLLGGIIEDLLIDYPHLNFQLYSGTSDDIQDKLDKGILDFGILLTPVNVDRYQSHFLPVKERWGVLVGSHSHLAKFPRVTVTDMENIPVIFPNRKEIKDFLIPWARGHQDNMVVIGSSNLAFNAIPLVEHEIGALVCIEGAVKNRINAEVTFVPMEPSLYSEMILVWKESRYLSLVAQEFLKRIKVYYPAELF